MSPYAQHTLELLKEINEYQQTTDKGAGEIQEPLEDGEEVLDPDNTSSGFNSVLNTFNNEFEHECLEDAVSLLHACHIRQSIADQVPGNKYSIPTLPRTKFLAHQVRAIWFNIRRWLWDSDMPGVLVADEMDLGQTFMSVVAAMICKLLTKKVVMGLLLAIMWGNTLEEWVNMAQNDYPGIIGEEWEWYPLERLNSVPCHCLEIQTTPH